MAGPGRPKKVMPDTVEPVEGVEPAQEPATQTFVDYNSEGTICRFELIDGGLYDEAGTLLVSGAKEGTASGEYTVSS